MLILNRTGYPTQFTMARDVAGREFLLLVVKATFDFPDTPDRDPHPARVQRPLVMADEYTGAPGFSAPLWESDFAFRKARCDVVLNGAAHAPGGRPVERVRVGLAVGSWRKQFDVVGQREWRMLGPSAVATRPYPFTRQPFSYDTAFGGPDRSQPDDPAPPVNRENPVGVGWAAVRAGGRISGIPLPNTEAPDDPVTSPFGSYRAMSLGPIGRGWPARIRFGGTYDQAWMRDVFPFLPADFDERYYQMAPEDQQIGFPDDGAPVVLAGLTPGGHEAFRLPRTRLPIRVYRGREIAIDAEARPDTLAFDSEARQLMLVWRVWTPIRRIITEFTEAWIGPPSRGMLRARSAGKRYIAPAAADA